MGYLGWMQLTVGVVIIQGAWVGVAAPRFMFLKNSSVKCFSYQECINNIFPPTIFDLLNSYLLLLSWGHGNLFMRSWFCL